jgi:hypothetical protein
VAVALVYDNLTKPERAVWDALEAGTLVRLPLGASDAAVRAKATSQDEDRRVRAQLLADLLTGRTGPKNGQPRALQLAGAEIIGTLDLQASTLLCPLVLQNSHFDRLINLEQAVAVALRLSGCHLPGLVADEVDTRGSVQLNGVTTEGEVRLRGAHVGGQLILDGASLANPSGPALQADWLTVDHGMYCTAGFTAKGEIRLPGAHIGGQLAFDGACLTHPTGRALTADRLTVDQDVFLGNGFVAEGEVRLAGARIRGQLVFDGADLTNIYGLVLTAEGIVVEQGMFCRNGFTARGEVRLRGADIGGLLAFDDAYLANPSGTALDLGRVRADSLFLRPQARPRGVVDLTNARVDACYDSQASWPRELRLDGFAYEALTAAPEVNSETRLRWLELNPGDYAPRPYEQLVAFYRGSGREEDARKVAIAKQRRRRQALSWWGRVGNRLLDWTVGYGYRTSRAGLLLLIFLAAGASVFAYANSDAHRQLTPAKKPEELQHLNPLVYALDVLLPIVNLGQADGWVPHRYAAVCYWMLTLVGWVLTTAVVAALTGLIKKD